MQRISTGPDYARREKRSSIVEWRRLLLCTCAAAAMAVSARAGIVPDPIVRGHAGQINIFAPGSFAEGGAILDITSLPAVSLTALVTGLGSQGSGVSDGAGFFQYDVLITGGQFGDSVPLFVDGALSAHGLGVDGYDVTDSSATLALSFANGNHGAAAAVSCGNILRGSDCSNSNWSGTLAAVGWVGYDNWVELTVSATVAGAGFANAYADPHVYIDPVFLAANPGYDLVLNVGNSLAPATATPEPSSLLFAASALAGVALLRRRNRRAK